MINTMGHAYVLLDSWVESVGTVSTNKVQSNFLENIQRSVC